MNEPEGKKPVERLFPFVLRSRILIAGREGLARNQRRLHFVLITRDLSANSRAEVLRDFSHCPIVENYTSADLEKFFGIRNAKVVGFRKSSLAQSLYSEMKEHRLEQSWNPATQTPPGPAAGFRSGRYRDRRPPRSPQLPHDQKPGGGL